MTLTYGFFLCMERKKMQPITKKCAVKEKFCCEMMAENIASEDEIIFYWDKFREYGIPVHDGGSSMICINFCPWCGKQLPSSLRNEWFKRLKELGIDDPDNAPPQMQNDMWWKAR